MGYGYQERDLDKTIIDWSGLTKTISDGLSDEYKRREDLKFQIDKTQAEELKKISEFEQGSDPNANKWAMKQAQQARDFKMMNHRMMKDGLISVNDAKLISQNVMDGWAELNTGLKSYNENFKRIGELGGKGNEFLQGQMAKFADIENKSIWNDPKTGTAYFVDINPETGEVDKSTLKPVRSLNNIQAQSFETINVEEATAKLAKNAQPWELATSSTRSIKDARLNPVYKQWKENSLTSLLSSDQKIASTLMDYLDLDPTDDMNDDGTQSVTYERVKGYDDNGELIMETVNANIGKIKMKYENGKLVPDLTDAQRKLAKDAVEASLEAKLARTTKRQYVAPQRKSAGERSAIDSALIIDDFVSRGKFSGLKALLQNKADEVTLSEDKKTLTVVSGNESIPIDLTLPAKDIGVSIAGIISPTLASSYRNKSKASGSRGINAGALDSKIYGRLSTKTGLSSSQVKSIDDVLNPTYKEYSGEIKVGKANSSQVVSVVSRAAESLGLDPSKVTISITTNDLLYDGVSLGIIGQTSGSIINQKLSQLKSSSSDDDSAPI
jgi:hypothetical protein